MAQMRFTVVQPKETKNIRFTVVQPKTTQLTQAVQPTPSIQQPVQQTVQQTDPREERIKSLANNIIQVSSTLKNLQQKAQPFLQQDLEAGRELKTAKLPSEQEKLNTTNVFKEKAISDLQNTYTYKQDLASKLKDTIEGKTGQENLLSTVGAVGKDLGKGIFGVGENIADLGTYGAATLMGLTGREDLKEALIKNAKADSTGQLFKNADEYYNYTAEKGFKEGEAGSAMAQGIGYVGGVVGLGGLLPSQISQIKLNKIPLVNKIPLLKGLQLPTTSVLSGTGGGMSEALNEGATFEQAGVYGVGKGLLTGISEAIFGSVIGGKTGEALKKAYGSNQLDDVFVNYLTKNMGKGGSFATKLAYSGIGEGLEENIEGLLTPYLKRMTYDEKAELYTSQEALTDFMMGAVVALMVQSPSLARQVNQQAQQTGKTKQEVIKEVVKDIQPPAIADKNIETALNGEIDKAILQQTARPKIEPIQQQAKPLVETIKQNIETNTTSKDTKKQIINSKTGEAYTLNKPKEVKMTGNFYRNIRNLFDEKSAKQITGDFDQAKLDLVKRNNQDATELLEKTKQYNIKKGSKDSALVQQYGEKQITLDELKQKTKNWQNVVEFDKWFRAKYDTYIDNINDVRKSIYPNVEKSIVEYKEKLQKTYSQIEELSKDTKKNAKRIIQLKLKANSYETILENDELLRNKRVVKRKDYYRHFQEMSQGISALKNIMSTSSDIPAQMVGVSDFTKPNTKFSTIALRRKGTKTKYDAVGGFLNYIPTANYMISVDPQINSLRSLTKDIQQQMGDDTSANKAIEFLTEFTNKLAGKQNFLDRAVSKVTGRKIIKGISWLSGRIKSNLILGNVSSSLSQVLNLPQIVGKIKSPKLLLNGFKDSFSKTDYSKSQFITERYKSDILSQFDEGLLKKPKKFALWMLEALDEKVTKTGWNAFYREAVNKGITKPEQYADDNIRDMVSGRGIGEKTMLQESQVIGLIAPFTVEVGNMNTVLKGMLKDKKFLDLFITFVVARLLNEGIKQIGGGGSTIDPIKAVWEAATEKDLTMLERFGRIAGEVASNIPIGQVLATLYPEYGTDYLPTRKQLFGDNDPTRFGTGSMFSKALSSPLTTLVTPFGGAQIEKTIKGLSMFEKAVPGSYNNSGKLRFPVEDTPIKKIQSALFGEYGTSEANEYFDKNRRPLSDAQLNKLKYSDNIKRDYERIMQMRKEK